MYKDRFIIKEELPISETVGKMTNEVAKAILYKINNNKKVISKYTNHLLQKGIINIDMSKYLNNIQYLKVIYAVYYIDDDKEYELLDKRGFFGRSADFENKMVNFRLAMLYNKPADNFYRNIRNELKHIFQNDKGKKKNENLYDIVVDRYKNGEEWEQLIAWALYLSFKTEQDVFLSQYYEYLKTAKVKKEGEPIMDQNNPYYNFDMAFSAVEDMDIDEEALKNSFDITINRLYTILNAADERLHKKMWNVWTKYITEEIDKGNQMPNPFSMNFLLECYRKGIHDKVDDLT